uniref:Uncharacterized protein n=1 Tax=Chelonoidis abingdonii TaxID=106734 RepID=A0A8C0HCZ0_CHEAB
MLCPQNTIKNCSICMRRCSVQGFTLLLKKKRKNFPSQCVNERAAFKPTQDVVQLPVSQKENAKVAIQEILIIFNKNLIQSSWDGTSIVRFQSGLYQQIQWLEARLRGKELTSPDSEDLQLTCRRVKQYFKGIDAFLREKQYSLCTVQNFSLQ